jgi:hypothetical protein
MQAENEHFRRQLDKATRADKRQVAPCSKGQPTGQPKKPGKDYDPKAHRQPPHHEQIDEVNEAPLPRVCPDDHAAVLGPARPAQALGAE